MRERVEEEGVKNKKQRCQGKKSNKHRVGTGAATGARKGESKLREDM